MLKNTPQLLKGFRDFGPEKMAGRLFMMQKIRAAFERFGFEPMDTPALEYAETLLGKYGAEEKLMYRFADAGGRQVAMRYDLTVPLARFYAANKNELPKPFKRYQIDPVWRAENTQKGRFREFYQCDVDCVGSDSPVADAEVIAAVVTAIEALGVKQNWLTVRLNNRKIIDGFLDVLDIASEKRIFVLRELDKLDKVSEAEVKKGLVESGISAQQVTTLFDATARLTTTGVELRKIFQELITQSRKLEAGVSELAAVLDALASMDIKNLAANLRLARGLDYYTGTVCEIVLAKASGFGSIAGGGRYDNLIDDFAGGKEKIPAVGMSIGIDRLIAALEELPPGKSAAAGGCLVFNLDEKLLEVYLKVAEELRSCGINTDFYYQTDDFDKQFRYAEKKKINLGIFIGEEEIRKGEVTLKDLITRKQWKVKAEKLAEEAEKALR